MALLWTAILWAPASAGQAIADPSGPAFDEPAALQAAVSTGDLPPVSERLPERPLVMPVDAACPADRLGGTLRMIGGSAKDTRTLSVFGYARLVGYDEDYAFVPDIAERFEVEDGRVFTFHLRPGMKWSDGAPFTAEDFRYSWE
ncbi:MAG: ABC transporter substrate-binding protein, partial [Aurantimonas coralicida]